MPSWVSAGGVHGVSAGFGIAVPPRLKVRVARSYDDPVVSRWVRMPRADSTAGSPTQSWVAPSVSRSTSAAEPWPKTPERVWSPVLRRPVP